MSLRSSILSHPSIVRMCKGSIIARDIWLWSYKPSSNSADSQQFKQRSSHPRIRRVSGRSVHYHNSSWHCWNLSLVLSPTYLLCQNEAFLPVGTHFRPCLRGSGQLPSLTCPLSLRGCLHVSLFSFGLSKSHFRKSVILWTALFKKNTTTGSLLSTVSFHWNFFEP